MSWCWISLVLHVLINVFVFAVYVIVISVLSLAWLSPYLLRCYRREKLSPRITCPLSVPSSSRSRREKSRKPSEGEQKPLNVLTSWPVWHLVNGETMSLGHLILLFTTNTCRFTHPLYIHVCTWPIAWDLRQNPKKSNKNLVLNFTCFTFLYF